MLNSYKSLINMPFRLQMQNIGAEISRAIRFKNEGKIERAKSRAFTASEMLQVLKTDPKNKNRIKEFDFMSEEISDFVNGCEKYDIDVDSLLNQYEIFNDF